MGSFSYLQQFKIFRDIWQFSFIALYFVLMNIKTSVIIGFSVIVKLFSLDFIENPIATWILVLINFISTILLFYYSKYEPNDHFLTEAQTWKNKSTVAKAFVSLLLNIFTTFYLTFNLYVIKNGFLSKNGYLITLGVISFIYYDILFFLILMKRILRDIPTIMPFDSAGSQIEYSEAQYHILIEKSESPYKSFFTPYIKKWTYYEIYVMLNKIIALLIVTITEDLTDTSFIKNVFVIAIINTFLLVFEVLKAVFFWKIKPYYSIFDNRSAFIGCLMNILLYFLNYFLLIKQEDDQPNTPTQIIALVNFWIFSTLIVVLWSISSQSVILGQESFANFQKKYIKRKLDMTPISLKGMQMRPKDCLENYILFNPEGFSISDITLLFWNNFWEEFFNKLDWELVPPERKKILKRRETGWRSWIYDKFNEQNDYDILVINNLPPVMRPNIERENQPYTISERFAENKFILEAVGTNKYSKGLEFYKENYSFIKELINFIGPDIYFDGEFNYCNFFPFPFTMGLIKDAESNYRFIRFLRHFRKKEEIKILTTMEKFMQIKYLNSQNPEILQKKEVRMMLRALEGQKVKWSYEEEYIVKVKKSDNKIGYERITFYFKKGILRIARKLDIYSMYQPKKINLGPGLRISIFYNDGEGVDSQYKTHRKSKILDGSNFGACDPWLPTNPNLNEFFSNNNKKILQNIEVTKNNFREYRENMGRLFFENKIYTLTYDFNLKVINNFNITEQELRNSFRAELNGDLKHINFDEKFGKMLLLKKNMQENPKYKWWVLFWSDLWRLNSKLNDFNKCQNLLNPVLPSSFVYMTNMMEKDQLKTQLIQNKIFKYFKKMNMFEKIIEMISPDPESTISSIPDEGNERRIETYFN